MWVCNILPSAREYAEKEYASQGARTSVIWMAGGGVQTPPANMGDAAYVGSTPTPPPDPQRRSKIG